MLVAAPNKEELQTYAKEIEKQFKEVKILPNEKKNPAIVIFNVRDYDEQEVSQAIENTTEEKCKTVKIITTYKGRRRAFVTLTGTTLKKLEEEDKSKLTLGYRRCAYERHIPVLRCFRYHRFGHLVKLQRKV